MRWLAESDALNVETAYVDTFDRGRATSLHLFEHVHGDSRDRGPAMIDLAQTYEKAGLVLAPGEPLGIVRGEGASDRGPEAVAYQDERLGQQRVRHRGRCRVALVRGCPHPLAVNGQRRDQPSHDPERRLPRRDRALREPPPTLPPRRAPDLVALRPRQADDLLPGGREPARERRAKCRRDHRVRRSQRGDRGQGNHEREG